MEEKDFKQTILSGRAKGNVEATKGFADETSTVVERNVARPFDLPHDSAGDTRSAANAQGKGEHWVDSVNRSRQAERFVWTLAVIDIAPAVELRLTLNERAPRVIAEQLQLKSAMEALILAVGG